MRGKWGSRVPLPNRMLVGPLRDRRLGVIQVLFKNKTRIQSIEAWECWLND